MSRPNSPELKQQTSPAGNQYQVYLMIGSQDATPEELDPKENIIYLWPQKNGLKYKLLSPKQEVIEGTFDSTHTKESLSNPTIVFSLLPSILSKIAKENASLEEITASSLRAGDLTIAPGGSRSRKRNNQNLAPHHHELPSDPIANSPNPPSKSTVLPPKAFHDPIDEEMEKWKKLEQEEKIKLEQEEKIKEEVAERQRETKEEAESEMWKMIIKNGVKPLAHSARVDNNQTSPQGAPAGKCPETDQTGNIHEEKIFTTAASPARQDEARSAEAVAPPPKKKGAATGMLTTLKQLNNYEQNKNKYEQNENKTSKNVAALSKLIAYAGISLLPIATAGIALLLLALNSRYFSSQKTWAFWKCGNKIPQQENSTGSAKLSDSDSDTDSTKATAGSPLQI